MNEYIIILIICSSIAFLLGWVLSYFNMSHKNIIRQRKEILNKIQNNKKGLEQELSIPKELRYHNRKNNKL